MTAPLVLHANAVALAGRGLLILGAAGSGKSALSLDLIGRGARLISDDRTEIRSASGVLILCAPENGLPLIEARGLGLLPVERLPQAPLFAALDLDQTETERLPPHRSMEILGQQVTLLYKSCFGYFPAALQQYLLQGRRE